MEHKSILKSRFLVFIILFFVKWGAFYFLWGRKVTVKDAPVTNKSFGGDHGYLWRPYTINYSNVPSGYVFNDRIVDQLSWTRRLFQLRNQEELLVKNILLVLGDITPQFWKTENKISCPGFFISDKKCRLTIYSNSTNASLRDFDAVIYTKGRQKRKPDQVTQIMYEIESPTRSYINLNERTLWVSYYRGSDIVLPYSKWLSFDDKIAKIFNQTRKKDNLLTAKDYSIGKLNFAVAFISHCKAYSNRDEYINQLKKYISVNVFGWCGTKIPCNAKFKSSSCLQSVVKKYKFYLAFENSNCRDYITEKLFRNAFMNDVVPVVMGAHPDDYLAVAPPNSYIHVEDFHSPKELADYLTLLHRNDTLYNEYFKWKGTGFFYAPFKDLFCRVCGMMFYYDYIPPRHRWPENTTWASIDMCLPKGQWYWNRTYKM